MILDTDNRVVGVDYFGEAGLRAAQLEKLPHLQIVSIIYGSTLTADDIAYLSTLSGVSELNIGGLTIDPPVEIKSDLKPLEGMKGLEFVHLCKHDIKDDDLQFVAALPKLADIEFNGRGDGLYWQHSVTDQCADHLVKAKGLKGVWIDGYGPLTDNFLEKLTAGLPGLVGLHMGSPQLTDESLRLLATRCKHIEHLNMRSDRFTDNGIQHLVSAQRLQSLWLEADLLTGRCVEPIGQLKSLNHLGLSIRNISDEGVQALAGLKNLQILSLRKPELTDAQFAKFRGHDTLEVAYINGKSLSIDRTLETIAAMSSLRMLEVETGVLEPNELQKAVNRALSGRKPKP
ncbi:MAG: hypothetical protein U0795_02770 [Pirellulales bacterium]